MKTIGSCLCGSIEFSITDMSNNIYQCHCSLCRKQGGSASNTGTVVPLRNFQWTKGKENIKSWVKDSGFRSDFCSLCGSPVPNPLREFDYYWIPVGTLDDGPFNIVASIYTESKATWGVVAPVGTRHKTMPMFEEFIALLRNGDHG
ncbi:GFA family protein [Desulforhopalus sp. IMCC35007]|uniref:GFA family protein n=1 Tax=Desulforhopalus sp. IMCC35007 TaxID=2569543 RepID=UPI0010ADE73D|nr:GFA family protein [Desulforhopalus sp. IMCC35007]TKB05588.1 GFA family protein [Desulforhopalus sp. IMCC35007]